jgi:hypothetical protein
MYMRMPPMDKMNHTPKMFLGRVGSCTRGESMNEYR